MARTHTHDAVDDAGDADERELVTVAVAAKIFGVHPQTFKKYVKSGDAPEPLILGTRGRGRTAQAFRWRRSELRRWIDEEIPRASETDATFRGRSLADRGKSAAELPQGCAS